ncbi:lytic transglycosylase domain-containing protein [Kingella kingae]|uniref:lytic transglycosylase domain-containing protein n=2 Tax=Kingella kingae TaxID=504 RepID=UPI00254BE721|nr:lytic transglycosylase domain-containing protein [Kingella kingae]MDK4545743.1 lytic transglycosylase domain-containing protein [Kingella kingae]MDK4567556.1 lytic transglycosylase domain-containing protein [Kingella kingae]MDK4591500.1 lytic transglycosylase domain-containing protein [Kingella kingae]MDK4629477.1 lytic transglycosylase domain-containing protein [Kingella kingae]MDK4637422.1 lytic transglycosylase domain-containing protein [Kingella kingae]
MVIDYNALLQQCTNSVHPQIMHGIIRQESSFNPYAIGVVNGKLSRQPRSKAEAVSVIKTLQSKGMNYSMGLAQVNKQHMSHFGFTAESIFEPCANVRAGSKIFDDCYTAAKRRFGNTAHAIGAALSCYYSGNFTTGFKRYGNDKAPYVDSVRTHMQTYDKRSAQIGTPQLQKASMSIKVQVSPQVQTAALTNAEPIQAAAQPEAYREKSFLIKGDLQQTVSHSHPLKQNSNLLF